MSDKRIKLIILVIIIMVVGSRINANEKQLSDGMNAISAGNATKIVKIINENDEPDLKNMLLWEAVHKKNAEIVNILLDKGADASYHPDNEYNPLMTAIHFGSTKIVAALLLHGADPDEGYGSEDVFESPLTAAVDNNDIEIIKLLLDKGADPYGVYQSEIPAILIYAIWRGNEKAVKFLLSNNIDPNTLNLYNENISTALTRAKEQRNKNLTIIKMLESAGAKDVLSEKELTIIAKDHKSERMRKEAAFALQKMKSIK